jgi:antitoxin HicB
MHRDKAKLTPEPDGGYVVTFPQFPEAFTQGDTRGEALLQAGCLDEAVAARIAEHEPIPRGVASGRNTVEISSGMAAKAALYDAVREAKLTTTSAMARRLHVAETEVRRLLDPHHRTRLARLDAAMRRLGKRLRIEVVDLE